MSLRRILPELAARAAAARSNSAEAMMSRPISSTTSSTSSVGPHSFQTSFAVATCGNGDHGRLGHGNVSSLSHFTLVGELSSSPATRPVAVAAGGAHTLILTADGAVLSFGLNDAGQLGHSESAGFVTVPMEALIPEEAIAIAAGDRHSLAVGASGRVWAWGAGAGAGAGPGGGGGAGGGSDALSPAARLPRLVPGISSASSVAAGSAHSLILCRGDPLSSGDGRGAVYSWGEGSRGALGHGEGAASATGSGFFSFFSFSGSKRKLRGRAAAERAAPRLLRTLAGYDVEAVAASGSRSGAVVRDRSGSGGGGGGGGRSKRVLLWGDDGGFRAAVSGAGRAALDAPAEVPGLASLSVSLLALGRSHALAVRDGGAPLLAWGDGGDHGALGLSPPVRDPSSSSRPPAAPTAVDAPCRVTALDGEGAVGSVSAGWKHSLACCDVPARSAFGSDASSPSSSPRSLFSWGWGGSQGSEGPLDPSGASTGGGQLGAGDDLDRPRPFAVPRLVASRRRRGSKEEGAEGSGTLPGSSRFLTRWRALAVSAGLNHSAALVEVALDE